MKDQENNCAEPLAGPKMRTMFSVRRLAAGIILMCAVPWSAVARAQTPTPSFSDVPASHPYDQAIYSLAKEKIVSGYADGSFRPDAAVNRAELLVMAYKAAGKPEPPRPKTRCFVDILPIAWYAPYVCAAKQEGVVSGYADRRFRPSEPVTLSAAAKIIVLLGGLPASPSAPGSPWYAPFLQSLSETGALPPSLRWVGQELHRGELAEILWRVRWKHRSLPGVTLSDLGRSAPCQASLDMTDKRFDLSRVRSTWFSWINQARSDAGLPAYAHDRQLDRTANDWSATMAARGSVTHRRNPADPYYDYSKITAWFAERGIVARNVNRATHTENIGSGVLSCSEGDCTDELIDALRPTFDYFMSEKKHPAGSFARAHYESIMHDRFTRIGFGVVVAGNKVYSTTHYVTEIASEPLAVCEEGMDKR